MKIISYLLEVLVFGTVLIGLVGTTPTLPRSLSSNLTTISNDNLRPMSRQLVMNADVATAATGLNNGNPSLLQNPLQSYNVLQQVTKSGNNPMAVSAEIEAQQQEALQLRKQNQQQGALAAVQTKQDHVATLQAAITNQSHMVNGNLQPTGISLQTLNPAAQQLQQQLEVQKQQLQLQQQLLKQQVKPEAQQLTPQQILMTQLLREPLSKRPQLMEQIKQTQTKQEAEYLVNPNSQQRPINTQSSRADQDMLRYKMLMQLLGSAYQGGNTNRLGYNIDPTSAVVQITSGIPITVEAQLQQLQHMLLLQRHQHQYMYPQPLSLNSIANPFVPF